MAWLRYAAVTCKVRFSWCVKGLAAYCAGCSVSRPFRVLVTRAPKGASALAEQLRVLGMQPILIPAIETVEPSSFAALDDALGQMNSYGWLVFTSATAVEAFARRVGSGFQLPETLRVAAIGPATARALDAMRVPVTLLPAQAVAESLTAELLPFARQPDGRAGRFLLVRAEEAREVLPETLRAAGAEVRVVPAYRTVIPEGSVDLLRGLLVSGGDVPDAVTFTSSSTARNLVALCEAAGIRLPEGALRVSIGPITSQTMRELRLAPHAEAREATVAALAEAVLGVLQERGSKTAGSPFGE